MGRRGSIYWRWADPALHSRCHEETYADGVNIDVQVRLSGEGVTQLFIGVYAPAGMPLLEEAYDSLPHQTMTQALDWGIGRARASAGQSLPSVLPVAGLR
ncbi:hypothetical protein [Pseudomonas kermanshahensis]|uniref:hypothetical protein n=1 Tax=Pseudomonas kermanshahensis TaxID=2745482 RepID=UPI002092D1D4|nr:hypothetical protein [Pseudomonas kermanshahensis]USS54204.1 hypothetical protein NG836_20655 [Pseudomonas kermanshahensis]